MLDRGWLGRADGLSIKAATIASLVLLIVSGWHAGVLAQPQAPARGPAELIERSQDRGEKAMGDSDAVDSNQPAAQGHGGTAKTLRRALGQGPPLTEAKPAQDLEAGTIEITVVDGQDRPVRGAKLALGVMEQQGARDRKEVQTDAQGMARFEGLPTGTAQAYRVNLPYKGATYSSPPFQLPTDHGYQVRLVRLPVTRDDRVLLQWRGDTVAKFHNERLRVTQRARLMNVSEQTYVFPQKGQLVKLPEGFTAFQSQEVMTDQSITPADEGFRLKGSLPPGVVSLVWQYDLPIDGDELKFSYPIPWKTHIYRLITDAPEGMELDIEGMPPPQQIENQQETLFLSETRRQPGDPPLGRLAVTMRNLPGPGPWRFIAVGAAVLLMGAGLGFSLRGGGLRALPPEARTQRQQELLTEARALQEQHASGEVGPNYHARRMEELTVELAELLKQNEEAQSRHHAGT